MAGLRESMRGGNRQWCLTTNESLLVNAEETECDVRNAVFFFPLPLIYPLSLPPKPCRYAKVMVGCSYQSGPLRSTSASRSLGKPDAESMGGQDAINRDLGCLFRQECHVFLTCWDKKESIICVCWVRVTGIGVEYKQLHDNVETK